MGAIANKVCPEGDRPFFRDFFPFIRKEKFRKLLPLGAKRAPKVTDAFGVYRFCTRHQRVNSNENQICSKWSVIKWETLIRIILLKKLFPPEKGKIPWSTRRSPFVFVPDTRGLTLMKIKYVPNGHKMGNFYKKMLFNKIIPSW